MNISLENLSVDIGAKRFTRERYRYLISDIVAPPCGS